MHFLSRTFSCGKRCGTTPARSPALPPPATADATELEATQSLRPLGILVRKKRVCEGSRRLAAETLDCVANPCRLPHAELCRPPTTDTVVETTARDEHHHKSRDGGGKAGRAREGLHWAQLKERGWAEDSSSGRGCPTVGSAGHRITS